MAEEREAVYAMSTTWTCVYHTLPRLCHVLATSTRSLHGRYDNATPTKGYATLINHVYDKSPSRLRQVDASPTPCRRYVYPVIDQPTPSLYHIYAYPTPSLCYVFTEYTPRLWCVYVTLTTICHYLTLLLHKFRSLINCL